MLRSTPPDFAFRGNLVSECKHEPIFNVRIQQVFPLCYFVGDLAAESHVSTADRREGGGVAVVDFSMELITVVGSLSMKTRWTRALVVMLCGVRLE